MVQSWLNADGLYKKFGASKAVPDNGGEYATVGDLRTIELRIDLTTLTEVEVIQSDQIFFPKTVRIQEVEVVTHTPAATGTAIDVGLVRASDRSTAIDADGFLVSFPAASMSSAGEVFRFTNEGGGTGEGALIGTTNATYVGMITASRTDSTAFTAGVIYVRIKYYVNPTSN